MLYLKGQNTLIKLILCVCRGAGGIQQAGDGERLTVIEFMCFKSVSNNSGVHEGYKPCMK